MMGWMTGWRWWGTMVVIPFSWSSNDHITKQDETSKLGGCWNNDSIRIIILRFLIGSHRWVMKNSSSTDPIFVLKLPGASQIFCIDFNSDCFPTTLTKSRRWMSNSFLIPFVIEESTATRSSLVIHRSWGTKAPWYLANNRNFSGSRFNKKQQIYFYAQKTN